MSGTATPFGMIFSALPTQLAQVKLPFAAAPIYPNHGATPFYSRQLQMLEDLAGCSQFIGASRLRAVLWSEFFWLCLVPSSKSSFCGLLVLFTLIDMEEDVFYMNGANLSNRLGVSLAAMLDERVVLNRID